MIKDYFSYTDDNSIGYHLNQSCTIDPSPQKVDCDLSESFAREEKYWQVHRRVNHLKIGEIFCKELPRASFLWFARFVDCIATKISEVRTLDKYVSFWRSISALFGRGIYVCISWNPLGPTMKNLPAHFSLKISNGISRCFFLCKIEQPVWQQVDRRSRNQTCHPWITKLKNKKQAVKYCFEKPLLWYWLIKKCSLSNTNSKNLHMSNAKVISTKYYMKHALRTSRLSSSEIWRSRLSYSFGKSLPNLWNMFLRPQCTFGTKNSLNLLCKVKLSTKKVKMVEKSELEVCKAFHLSICQDVFLA